LGRAAHALLLGLAPGGVCLAGPVTRAAGELLPHLFTLTVTADCFCGTVHRVAPPGCYPAPCSVELGLSSDGLPLVNDEVIVWEGAARDRLARLSTDLTIAHTRLIVKRVLQVGVFHFGGELARGTI
jgi:hypothetical protein